MVFGCVWEKGCVFERLRREEPRLALNDGCFGDEVEGKGGEGADRRGRLAGGGEEF
jgi:hypothetical protein